MDEMEVDETRQEEAPLRVDLSKSILTDSEKKMFWEMLQAKKEAFAKPGKLACTHLVKHKIELIPNAKLVKARPYRMAPQMRRELEKILQEQLDKRIIEPAVEGPWASPAFLVKKSNGKFHLVCDLREVNIQVIDQTTCIPRIEQIIDTVNENQLKYLSKMDLTESYYQI